jgi:hypothetical protein
LQLDAPAQAPAGKPVPITLTLTNTSKQPVKVALGGRPPFDVVVTTADGAETWRWSDDQVIQMILEMRTLQPGEQVEYVTEWPVKDRGGNPASPGRYLVRGVLNMDPPEKLETSAKELLLVNN